MICAYCILFIVYILYRALHLHLQLLTSRLRNLKQSCNQSREPYHLLYMLNHQY